MFSYMFSCMNMNSYVKKGGFQVLARRSAFDSEY